MDMTAKVGDEVEVITYQFTPNTACSGNKAISDKFEIDNTTINEIGTGTIKEIDIIETTTGTDTPQGLDLRIYLSNDDFTAITKGSLWDFEISDLEAKTETIGLLKLDGVESKTTKLSTRQTYFSKNFKTNGSRKLYGQIIAGSTSGTYSASSKITIKIYIKKD